MDLMSPHTALMAPSPQSAGQDLAVTGLAMKTSMKMEVRLRERRGKPQHPRKLAAVTP